jgi:hypothetical protein
MMKRTAGLVLALAATPLAHALDDASFARCGGIPDAGARLACYDGLPMGAPPSAAQPPPIAPSRTAPVAPPPARAPAAAAPQAQQQREFGMEQRAPAVEYPTTMETYIPGHFEGWRPNERIRLGNGQVWQVVDGSSAMFSVDNPKVVIRRGMMGGFFLEIGDSNRSPRVRRLQ